MNRRICVNQVLEDMENPKITENSQVRLGLHLLTRPQSSIHGYLPLDTNPQEVVPHLGPYGNFLAPCFSHFDMEEPVVILLLRPLFSSGTHLLELIQHGLPRYMC